MDVEFDCPHCSQRIAADEEILGREVQCPSCQVSFTACDETPHNQAIVVTPTRKETIASIQQVSIEGERLIQSCKAASTGCMGWALMMVGFFGMVTVVGIIPGILMIIVGCYMCFKNFRIPKIEQVFKDVYVGKCPDCGYNLSFDGPAIGHDCPACKKRFVIHGNRFVSIQ